MQWLSNVARMRENVANGSAIRVIREAKKCSLRALQERTGIHRGYLSHIELGNRGASLETAKRIADALDVPVAAITYPEPKQPAVSS